MKDQSYELKAYAEGVEIPVYGVTRRQVQGQPLNFTLRMPAIPESFRVLPNTLVQVFVRRPTSEVVPPIEEQEESEESSGENSESSSEESEESPEEPQRKMGEEWVLFAEGRVKARNLKSGSYGSLSTFLRCEGFFGDWDEVKMGFDIGQSRDYPRPRESHFFFGFSTGKEENKVPVEGFEAGQAGATMKGAGEYAGPYQSFFFGVQKMMTNGPVQAAVGTVATMPNFSPLFRRRYLGLNTQRRLGFVENKKIIGWLKDREAMSKITQRMKSMPASASLVDVLKLFLRDSRHKFVNIPSPTFHPENLPSKKEKENKKESKSDGDGGREMVGGGKGESEEEERTVDPNQSAEELLKDPRIKAYLDNIARSEFQGNLSKEDQYGTAYGGITEEGRDFVPEEDGHPYNRQPLAVKKNPFEFQGPDGRTTAAGRYQFQVETWEDVGYDTMAPENQDLAAVKLLKQQNAVSPILNGDIKTANDRVHNIWASIPNEAGQGTSPNQPVPYGHEKMTKYQNSRLRHWTGELGGKVPAAHLDDEIIKDSLAITQVMPSLVFLPDLFDAPPPLSNVVFPDQIEDFRANESFKQATTRIMMRSGLSMKYQGLSGAPSARAMARDRGYAPRRIAFTIDRLKGYTEKNDTMTPEERKELSKRINEATVEVSDLDEETMKDLERAAEKRKQLQYESEIRDKDILENIAAGDTELPGGLLSMYTLDELFRGLHPKISQFPFMRLGDAPDEDESGSDSESAGAKIEEDIRKAIAENFKRLSNSPFNYKKVVKDSKNIEKGSEEYRNKRDEIMQTVTAESIYANYQYMKVRRRPRRLSYSGPLNLDLAAGFTGAVYHPSIGWSTGFVTKVTDRIDVQNNRASTEARYSYCRFLSDLQNPVWKHLEMSADAETNQLNDAGLASNPVFFDDKFSPGKIGDSVYQHLLRIGSIYDWAKENMDAEEPESELSTLQILNEIYNRYRDHPSQNYWRRNNFSRRIIREAEVFYAVMGATLNDSGNWGERHHVFEMPEEGEVFVEERANWAIEYANQIKAQNYSIDSSFGAGITAAKKKESDSSDS